MRSWPSALIAGVVCLAVWGCDTLAEENGTIILPEEKVVTFRYEFDAQGWSAGESLEVAAQSGANLTQDLLRDGFAIDEVVSAQVVGVELERIMPLNVNLSFLSEAAVELTASNVSSARIGRSTSLPSERSTTMTIVDQSATRFVRSPIFSSRLVITPAQLSPEEDYVLQATVRLRIEVQDF